MQVPKRPIPCVSEFNDFLLNFFYVHSFCILKTAYGSVPRGLIGAKIVIISPILTSYSMPSQTISVSYRGPPPTSCEECRPDPSLLLLIADSPFTAEAW